MANTLTIDQISPLLRKILAQATGRSDIGQLNTEQLLTIGQKAITTAPDPLLKSISQVVTRVVFSSRPYTAKFAQLKKTEEQWGNIVRKLAIMDKESDVQNSENMNLVDGSAVDQYKVDNTKILELSFCGQQTYTICKTIYKDQFNTCFNSAGDFGRFIAMILQYVSNKIEKIHEETARATISAAMGGLKSDSANPERVVHLVTEFKAETGLPGEGQNIYDPVIFDSFVKWVYSRVEDIVSMMGEYSTLYQTKLTEGSIDRHTPQGEAIAFFYAPFFRQASNRVLADTYHNEMLKLIPNAEMVNFWQSIKAPGSINLQSAKYLDADGTVKASLGAVEINNVFGFICDREAVGYSPILTEASTTPYNARGHYWNNYWFFNERHYADFTEKMVMLVLD